VKVERGVYFLQVQICSKGFSDWVASNFSRSRYYMEICQGQKWKD